MARVLIVDDDPASRKPLTRLLEMEGHEVISASNAIMAMASALDCQPDLILLDVAMPPIDGLTFLFLLREKSCGRDLPVIVISGQEDDHTLARAKALGVRDYFIKAHFKTSDLLERVRELAGVVKAGEEIDHNRAVGGGV